MEKSIETKQFILDLVETAKHLLSKWRVWLIGLLLGCITGLVINLLNEEPPVFESIVVFNLEIGGAQSNAMGGLAGVLGLGGQSSGGSGDLFSAENFRTLVLSKAVLEKALLETVEVNGDSLLMINYVIGSSDIKTTTWAGGLFQKPFEAGINYNWTETNPEKFTPLENMIMSDIYYKVVQSTFIDFLPETASMMVLKGSFTNELLSKKWAETVLKTTSEFYTEVKTQKTRRLLNVQRKRLAEIEAELSRSDRQVARFQYENPNVVDPTGVFKETRANRSSNFLSNQYFTQLNNIETLNRMLLDQTPIFTILEESRLPLNVVPPKDSFNIKISSLTFLFLTLGFLSVVRTVKNILA